MTFYTGQKVTLIRQQDWVWPWLSGGTPPPMTLPQYGDVYTIYKVEAGDPLFYRGDVIDKWLYLHEIYGDHRFEAALFRPVCDRRFDISVFTSEPVLVDA
jgi:hypothetical protein